FIGVFTSSWYHGGIPLEDVNDLLYEPESFLVYWSGRGLVPTCRVRGADELQNQDPGLLTPREMPDKVTLHFENSSHTRLKPVHIRRFSAPYLRALFLSGASSEYVSSSTYIPSLYYSPPTD